MISFVICARNEEKYIEGCVRSIYEQSLAEDFEVIVADNNSTDRTAEVVRQAFPSAIIVDEPNAGINFARQAGFTRSRGDILIFLDADTRLTPGWTEHIVADLRADMRLVAISGPYRYYDATHWYLPHVTDAMQRIFHIWSYVANKSTGRNTILIAGDMAIKRQALEEIGGFDTRFTFYREDVDTAKRLLRQGRIIFSLKYPVLSSARRFNHMGLLRMTGIYFYHYVVANFTRDPAHSRHADLYR